MSTLLQQLVTTQTALDNCRRSGNLEWLERHKEKQTELCAHLPSGSGIDGGTTLLSLTESSATLSCDYHHMDPDGFYTHWSSYTITVEATFTGLNVQVVGEGEDIREYLAEVYHDALSEEV